MEIEKIISEIKKCIKEEHKFSRGLGGESSIIREQLESKLTNFTLTEIHIALIELNEKKEIEYNPDSGLIMINYFEK